MISEGTGMENEKTAIPKGMAAPASISMVIARGVALFVGSPCGRVFSAVSLLFRQLVFLLDFDY
jgi:hypothetical protein